MERSIEESSTSPVGLTVSQDEPTGCGAWALFNPHFRMHRFFVLSFICFLSFGSYFCYDMPAALADQIQKDMDVSASKYTLLYSLYSWPNTVLCFFGGFLIDRVFGLRAGTLIFSGFCIVGHFIVSTGAMLGPDYYWIMEAGRFVFGIGGESLAVAQNAYSVSWFKGAELNMVFGLQLSFSRLGSTLNMNIMTPIYNSFRSSFPSFEDYEVLGAALFVGFLLCIFSFMCGVIMWILDSRAARILKRKDAGTGEVIRITDVGNFPASFWLLSIICVMFYSAVFPFIAVGKIFFMGKFNLSDSSASLLNSIVYLISAGASPLCGFLVDRTGLNIVYLLISTIGTLVAHMLLAYTWANPWIAMIIMGICYSLCACALWPMAALIIPNHQLGTAYGMMQSIQNLGLALATLISGAIVESSGYLMLEVFFICCVFVAIISTVVLFLVDDYYGVGLNLTAKRRLKIEMEERDRAELMTNHSEVSSQADGSIHAEINYDVLSQPRDANALRHRLYSFVAPEAEEPVETFKARTTSLSRRSVVS
ncbi:major facilitator superfamily domain-containing protein 1-like [Symsagittifera roscoffensis]|uniref:major facilitator superfamily domain-containing protein 1-like n=1 Tax=Symsagittifera roscoffensis TaxID=84072 RepID=UPI00307C7720